MEAKLILRTMLSELEPQALPGWRARRSERMKWSHRTLAPSSGATVVWQRRIGHSSNGAMPAADPIGAVPAGEAREAD